MAFKNKLIAGFGAALAVLILVGASAYRSMVRNDDDRQWVTHTHLVIEKIDALLANMLDIETGARGYGLTGDAVFLQPYNGAVTQTVEIEKGLRELTVDNPVQQRSLDGLEPMVSEKLRVAHEQIETRTQGGLEAIAASPGVAASKQAMERIRAQLATMRAEENRLLLVRTQEASRSSSNTRIMIVAGGVLGVALLSLAGVVVGQEMKQRRHAEEAVRRLNTDLERRVEERTAELAGQTRELARSNGELQQFAYVASHDLQEPLRMVASFTQLLAKRYAAQLDDDARDFINFAVDGANRMQTLISDLLNYSRVGTQGKPLEPTDSDALLDRVLDGLRVAVEENQAKITHDSLPKVMADPMQLGQLFQNLLTNAMKFHGADSPRIHIAARKAGKMWEFSFRDNGIGIAEEHAERIFVIFQRLHTKTEYPGTGIGLAICKKIVERHGGRIWVEPTKGGGTTFCFTVAPAEKMTKERQSDELRIPAYTN